MYLMPQNCALEHGNLYVVYILPPFFKKGKKKKQLFLTKGGVGHLQIYESKASSLIIFLSYLTSDSAETAKKEEQNTHTEQYV